MDNKINLAELTEEELASLSKQLTEEKSARREAAKQKVLEERQEQRNKLLTERKDRAKAVEEAFKAAREAEAKANELLRDFVKDYGSWHYSFTSDNIPSASWVDTFWQNFFRF